MNIYFACSITGGRQFESVYQEIVRTLLADGHQVPTAHLAESTVVDAEAIVDPHQVYERDIAWLQACDMLIAEISVPSHGVGYEIAYALHIDKPVNCIYQQGQPISKMVAGNPHPRLTLCAYRDIVEGTQIIRDIIDRYE
jgi:nucleoside 2-deoxyribosyltransferase